jgi:hypothetical protein
MTRATDTVAALALAVALGSACSSGVTAVPLRSDRPGVLQYRVECDKDVERCRAKASEVCAGEYEILQSSGHAVEPKRIDTAPGPMSTGPNFARPSWAGELIVECGRRAARQPVAEPASSESESESVSVSAAPAATTPALGPDQVCVPGITQICLGPAACRGAQACLSDGRGFGACDCGGTSASPNASSEQSDAGASLPHAD